MGIDKLNKAANAAGFAMANSEDLLMPSPAAKKTDARELRPAEAQKPAVEKTSLSMAIVTFRDWWFSVSGKATA
jgi:hypothetical protein